MSDDNDNFDPIGKALGVPPIITTKSNALSTIVSGLHDDSAKTDFDKARIQIHAVIQNGSDAVVTLSEIASQTQDPKAFDSLSKMMAVVVNASEKLLDIQQKLKNLEKAEVPHNEKAKGNVTNNLFVGSTAELQKALKDATNG